MAKNRETFFLLDDSEDDEFGGFNDAPELPPEDDEQEDEKAVQDDEKKPDEDDGTGDEEEKKDDDPGEDGEKDPEEEEPEEETKVDPAEQRYNELIAMNAKKDEQINTLVSQVQTLTEKVTAKPVEKKEPPQKPEFTAQDWEDDPDGCSNALFDYRENLKEFNTGIEKEETETAEAERVNNLRAIHQKDLNDEVEDLPALRDPRVKKTWDEIYKDPRHGFFNREDGVIRATRLLKQQARANNIDLSKFGQENPPPKKNNPPKEDISPEEAKRKGAEDEAARSKRVIAGTMHTGGKSGGQKKINLTKAQIATAKQFGVSPEAYAKTLNSMGGK